MTFREKIKHMVMTANGIHEFMLDETAEAMMPRIEAAINNKAFELDHAGFEYSRSADEYAPILYAALWPYIKPVVLQYLEENLPGVWFKPMFMTREQRAEAGLSDY